MRRRDDPLHLPALPDQGFGELDADLSRLLAPETGDTTPFAVHSDSAPTYYVTGNPAQMAEVTRKLEHHVAALTAFDPIIDTDIPVTARLADQQEQSFLRMVTADPNRTPTFILFGDPGTPAKWSFSSAVMMNNVFSVVMPSRASRAKNLPKASL